MPVSKYFKGHGEKVMADMKKRYGAKKGKEVFYATANKRGERHSLHDMDALETAATPGMTSVKLAATPMHPGKDVCHDAYDRNEEALASFRARDPKNIPDYTAPVDCYGPDSQFSVQEIDPSIYGHDYDPIPDYGVKSIKKLHKKEDEQEDDGTLRQLEEWEYESEAQPGAFPEAIEHQAHFRRDEYNKPAPAKERQADWHDDFNPKEREDR